ncbi:MAG: YwiC-like family protein [Candidatus Sericytochromatia bacterium]
MSGVSNARRLVLPADGWGRPPLPREHGAWVMLITPLAIGLAGISPFSPGAAALLVLAVAAAFLAQNAASVLIKPRAPQSTLAWLLVFTAVLAAAGLGLLAMGAWSLLWLALPAAALFLLHVRLLKGPAAQRLDRTAWGELLACGALTLTGPAAAVVARGTLDATALALWLACLVAFASGVFHVNMRLDAVKVRQAFDGPTRWRLGKGLVAFHLAMSAALALAIALVPGPAAWMALAAYAPFVGRAGWSFVKLEQGVPSFKAIGIRETVLTTWFGLWAIALLRVLG